MDYPNAASPPVRFTRQATLSRRPVASSCSSWNWRQTSEILTLKTPSSDRLGMSTNLRQIKNLGDPEIHNKAFSTWSLQETRSKEFEAFESTRIYHSLLLNFQRSRKWKPFDKTIGTWFKWFNMLWDFKINFLEFLRILSTWNSCQGALHQCNCPQFSKEKHVFLSSSCST